MPPRALAIFAVGLFLNAGGREGDSKKDLDKFQGTWRLVSAVRDGKHTPPEELAKIKLAIHTNKFVLQRDALTLSEGTMTLEPNKKPKQLDETITAGPNKGKVFSAIYEIDDDQHRVCFAGPGMPRPTTFAAEPGSGCLYQVWKRAQK